MGISACGIVDNQKTALGPFIDSKAVKEFPLQKGVVNDYENLFTQEEELLLSTSINDFEKRTSNQICIVTISSYEPYATLMEFTSDLGNYWGVGVKGKDNGLIITVSAESRKVWIGSGYGTEKILKDEILKEIIDTEMLPRVKNAQYFEGVNSGLSKCIDLWDKNDTNKFQSD